LFITDQDVLKLGQVEQKVDQAIQARRAVSNIKAHPVRKDKAPGDSAETDRRVRRTRALLHTSLIELILRKGYNHITVQDILDEADVGRSTFYAHYRSKDDLLVGGWEEFRTAVAGQFQPTGEGDRLLAPTLALFRHVDEHRHLYQAMVGRQGSELVERSMRQLLSEMVANQIRSQLQVALGVVGQEGSERDEGRLELAVQFLVGGLIGLLTWWLDSEAPYTAEEMHSRFLRLGTPGIEVFLRDPRR
jgi:AcrR family transcriptional regulator